MRNVINEYAGSIIALLGTLGLFVTTGEVLMGKNGMLATLITMVLGGL